MKKGLVSIEEIEEAQVVLRAVANALRQDILRLLQEKNKMTVTELYVKLRKGQTNMSFHLGVLKDAGVVGVELVGKYRYYYIINERLEEINAYAKGLGHKK